MVDLREPIQLRVEMLDKDGGLVSEVVLGDDEPVVSPEQAASMALHADTVTRAKVYDMAGALLLDRRKDPDGNGYLDA
jgi:hypothetical protein